MFCSRFIFSFCLESIVDNTCIEKVTDLNEQQLTLLLHILKIEQYNTAWVSYHLPLGLVVKPTHAKWNHSMEHWSKEKKNDNMLLSIPANGALSRDKTMQKNRSKSNQSFQGETSHAVCVIYHLLINHLLCHLWPFPQRTRHETAGLLNLLIYG